MIPAECFPPLVRSPRIGMGGGAPALAGERTLAAETAVALTFDGATHAVMMATPADLHDFALGFSLSEGIVSCAAEILAIEVGGDPALGLDLRIMLADVTGERHLRRRRAMAGPVGCGLCGIESLAEAVRPARRVEASLRVDPAEVSAAMASLSAAQELNREARALHAAAFWTPGAGPDGGLAAIREDVGRHNALDKLAGALARTGVPGGAGAVLLTSRVSVEMVQKAARIGAPLLVAVSAPTALAVRMAEACGITLVAVARGDAFEVFTHPERVAGALN